jgi:DNA-directed RNA polymerase specialized sigma24 family protein
MGYAVRVIRGLIIDHARKRHAQKRGGQFRDYGIGHGCSEQRRRPTESSQISDALDELGELAPGLAEVMDRKFFCGCPFVEIAGSRNVSERTVQRSLAKASIYLH